MQYSSVVEQGSGYGRKLGFPTANIPLEDDSISGIYAARVEVDGATYCAAVFIDAKRQLLEAHLLDFSGDLYGKIVTVTLEKKLRESMQFPDEVKLKQAIAADVEAVRAYFA
ncbi:MAG: riboflavin kinase [Patescibacteria group bacterium]